MSMSSSENLSSNQPTVPITAPPKPRSKRPNRSPAFKRTVDLMLLLPIEGVAQAQNISVRQVYRRVSRFFHGRRDEYLVFRAKRRVVTLGREMETLAARTDVTGIVDDEDRRLWAGETPASVREERSAPLFDEPARRQPPSERVPQARSGPRTQVARAQISPAQEMQTPLDLNRPSRQPSDSDDHRRKKRIKREHRSATGNVNLPARPVHTN
jgi:hypothetical protein